MKLEKTCKICYWWRRYQLNDLPIFSRTSTLGLNLIFLQHCSSSLLFGQKLNCFTWGWDKQSIYNGAESHLLLNGPPPSVPVSDLNNKRSFVRFSRTTNQWKIFPWSEKSFWIVELKNELCWFALKCQHDSASVNGVLLSPSLTFCCSFVTKPCAFRVSLWLPGLGLCEHFV